MGFPLELFSAASKRFPNQSVPNVEGKETSGAKTKMSGEENRNRIEEQSADSWGKAKGRPFTGRPSPSTRALA
jgi:hypothetical protein